ncbi:putative dimethylaniline monooxygenase [Talaromyces proteolyticus]|uniref:Dimethylaniline monooxygenase n=1 Tax=Talaromyces proteolyticus TaxID=1131652 RepID=A0AAD4KDN1_9EURO|nr:putative dimethylaniline monooxygenase [Talaromyces proteolyticus]KAH8689106.1 putative dimethylaniline monooxygenase [Talaromyces proteolyticus]
MSNKVAVIGAGISGLVTAKECLEAGFPPTIFEKRAGIGGQWRYEDPDTGLGETFSSVYDGVLTNSSSPCTQFSDFPIDPSRYPDYLGHEDSLRYLQEYADHFGLETYVRLNTEVIGCEPLDDGRWIVATVEGEEIYDALFVCAGRNNVPKGLPTWDGLDSFKGNVIHSHLYRRPTPYTGRRVAVLGLGPSAVDIASEICPVAESCYIITRRGGWILPRYVRGEITESLETRFREYMLPRTVHMRIYELVHRFVMGDTPNALKPEHHILQVNPVYHEEFLDHVRTRRIKAHRTTIKSFTETGISLDNGSVLDVDDVIICIGYRVNFPFISANTYRGSEPNSLHLYRLITPPKYSNLFFIGQFTFAATHPVSELQARWAVGVLSGKISLPSEERMETSIQMFANKRATLFINSSRHLAAIPMLEYMDTLASDMGINPTLHKLLGKVFSPSPLSGLSMLRHYYNGLITSAPYRLFGHGRKPDIAEATMLRLSRGGKELSREEKNLLAAQSPLIIETDVE